MISLELAKKLKDAGLKWELKYGDFYSFGDRETLVVPNLNYNYDSTFVQKMSIIATEGIWLPSLSQLLEEVERRGWGWDLDNMNVPSDPMYNLGLFSGDYGFVS